MADAQQWRFRLWPWRQRQAAESTGNPEPTAQELAAKLADLVHFERGVAALYYYLPDATLSSIAERLCQARQAANMLEAGVDRDLRAKEVGLDSWSAVSALWYATSWQPSEILATCGFRIIEALRAEPELWNVVVDPRAQSFGLAVTTDEQGRYWMALVIGQKGQDMGGEPAAAAR
jgi:hypothetical protein